MSISWHKIRLSGFLLRIRPTILVHFLKALLKNNRVVIQNKDGYFYIDLVSHFGQVLTTQGVFEPETRRIIKEVLPSGGTFIDIGANEGYFSVIAAQQVGLNGQVISIEPQERLIPIIRKNALLNKQSNIKILNLAVSDKDMSNTHIWLSPSTISGSSSVVNKYFLAKPQYINTRTLEGIFEELSIDKAHLIKIDVEGFEPEIIQGSCELFKSHRVDQILIDFHLSILQKRGIDPRGVHIFLESIGYRQSNNGFTQSGYNLYKRAVG